MKDHHPPRGIVKKKIAHENPYFRTIVGCVEMLNGDILDPYFFTEFCRESVAVVPVRQHNEVLLGRTWRPLMGELSWEVPAGFIEEGETARNAARRELLEETGYEAIKLDYLGSVHPSNATSTERVHVVVVIDPRSRGQEIDQREIGDVVWVTRERVSELIRKREITDGISLIGLLLVLESGYLRQ